MNCPHCDTPIDEHEASRCLDAWVAEVALGKTVPNWDENTPCPVTGGEMRYCGERSWCYDCRTWHYGPADEYSTFIAAAWEVVEKLKEDKFWFSLVYKSTIFPNDLDKAGWSAQFRCVHGGTRGDHFGTSIDPPLAICRAAIKAISVASSDETRE